MTRGLKVLNSEQCSHGGAAPRGTATVHGQSFSVANKWIKEGRNSINWTKLSCRIIKDTMTLLQLFALAYNLGNFLRRLASPKSVRHWSLMTVREKLIENGAKVTQHAKYVTFQLAAVAVTRNLFAAILALIARLAISPSTVAGRAT